MSHLFGLDILGILLIGFEQREKGLAKTHTIGHYSIAFIPFGPFHLSSCLGKLRAKSVVASCIGCLWTIIYLDDGLAG